LYDLPLILDHCGKPDVKKQDLKTWDNNIKILAENPNVYCKISGLLTEADWHNWTEQQIFNCFDVIFKYFGVERTVYGSDWPVVNVSRPYIDWYNLVLKYVMSFDEKERDQIFVKNVIKFYQLS